MDGRFRARTRVNCHRQQEVHGDEARREATQGAEARCALRWLWQKGGTADAQGPPHLPALPPSGVRPMAMRRWTFDWEVTDRRRWPSNWGRVVVWASSYRAA